MLVLLLRWIDDMSFHMFNKRSDCETVIEPCCSIWKFYDSIRMFWYFFFVLLSFSSLSFSRNGQIQSDLSSIWLTKWVKIYVHRINTHASKQAIRYIGAEGGLTMWYRREENERLSNRNTSSTKWKLVYFFFFLM